MTSSVHEIRAGAYYDSVVLMQLQRQLLEIPGVVDAGVVMATPANMSLLEDRELVPENAAAGPDDLLIVVRADSESSAEAAIGQVDELLTRRRSSTSHDFRPRSLDAARKALPESHWVLISVPGRYAADVAREALALDQHVFLYSDNVEQADEIELKRIAGEKGLLVMGPDCGTAIIGGIGLGFANRVRRGRIGVVGASGTGIQAITSAIHQLGEGISHAIGTGGRDLKAEVGAATAMQALDLLRRNAETEVIVIVSKPPSPSVAARLLGAARSGGKPVVVNFIGYAPPGPALGNITFATSLQQAAELAVELARSGELPPQDSVESTSLDGRKYLRGLFSGGTLAYEALQGLQIGLSPIYSNIPIREEQRLEDITASQAHSVLDLGEDDFTVGRLHPMMDNELRIHRLRQEAADAEVRLILLDFVLGEGAHPDPASELAPVIKEVTNETGVEVAALVIGTEDDPQDMASQIQQLKDIGVHVFTETLSAVEFCIQFLVEDTPQIETPVSLEGFASPLAAINVGLESFYESLSEQGAGAIQVEWRPPAGGNAQLMDILARMK